MCIQRWQQTFGILLQSSACQTSEPVFVSDFNVKQTLENKCLDNFSLYPTMLVRFKKKSFFVINMISLHTKNICLVVMSLWCHVGGRGVRGRVWCYCVKCLSHLCNKMWQQLQYASLSFKRLAVIYLCTVMVTTIIITKKLHCYYHYIACEI